MVIDALILPAAGLLQGVLANHSDFMGMNHVSVNR
jgi:hypothetical protein